MRAAISRGLGDTSFTLDDISLASTLDREVVISVLASGLCASDMHVLSHPFGVDFPVVLGHEVCGRVIEVGAAVTRVSPGDLVIACLVRYCDDCAFCNSGRPSLCTNPASVDRVGLPTRLSQGDLSITQFVNIGGFAEQALVHENQLYRVPDGMDPASASIVGCAVVTGAGTVWNAAAVQAGESVAIVGCGGVGLQAIQAARIAGATKIVAIDVDEAKLATALNVGATEAVRHVDDDVTLRQISSPVDKAMEFVGTPRSALSAIRLTRKEGHAFLVGLHRPGVTTEIDVHRELFSQRRSVTAVEMGGGDPRTTIPRIFQSYVSGEFLLDDMVSSQVALDEISRGYRLMSAGSVGRVVALVDH